MESVTIGIHTDYIQLDQLLKWANVISTGGQVKMLLDDEAITINGALCHEKRKKLYPGDVVKVADIGTFTVVHEAE